MQTDLGGQAHNASTLGDPGRRARNGTLIDLDLLAHGDVLQMSTDHPAQKVLKRRRLYLDHPVHVASSSPTTRRKTTIS